MIVGVGVVAGYFTAAEVLLVDDVNDVLLAVPAPVFDVPLLPNLPFFFAASSFFRFSSAFRSLYLNHAFLTLL